MIVSFAGLLLIWESVKLLNRKSVLDGIFIVTGSFSSQPNSYLFSIAIIIALHCIESSLNPRPQQPPKNSTIQQFLASVGIPAPSSGHSAIQKQ